MKKATISLIIFLMSLSGAFGQAFKIIGGISRARFTELPGWGTFLEESFVSDYKPGSVFGIGVEFPLDRYLRNSFLDKYRKFLFGWGVNSA